MGGFPYVVEAVGSPQSVTEALRAVAHRGTVLLLGAAGISEVDLTPIWYKEAALVGSIDHTVDAAVVAGPGRRPGPPLGRPCARRARRRPPARLGGGDARVPARGLPRGRRDGHRPPHLPRHQGRRSGPEHGPPRRRRRASSGPRTHRICTMPTCRQTGQPASTELWLMRRASDRGPGRAGRRRLASHSSLARSRRGRAAAGTSGQPTSGAAGPAPPIAARFNVNTDAFTGADGTASAIGWLGDHNSVITCLGRDLRGPRRPGDLFQDDGFGIYDGQRTTWADAGGYLPAQVTTFDDRGATVSITEFADKVVLGGNPFVAVYSRVHVANPTGHAVTADPEASPTPGPARRRARHRARRTAPSNHDYVVALRPLRRRRSRGPAPRRSPPRAASTSTSRTCARSGTPQLAAIAQISVPDRALVDAYKSGFITTQITRSGNDLDTGVNGYESEFSHDVVGILTNLFTQGYFTDAHALLDRGPQRGRVPGPVRRRPLDLRRALGRVPAEDRRHGVRGAELRVRGPAGAARTEHRGRRPRHRGRPDRADGDDGGHRRHRHPGVLDHRRLRGPARPGRLPLRRRRRSATTTEATWATSRVRQPARGDQRRARPDHRPEPPRLPALLAAAAEHRQPLRQPAGRQLDLAVRVRQPGPGRAHSSAPPSAVPARR